MHIVQLLPDTVSEMSGVFTGKDLSILPFLLDLYNVEDKQVMVQIIMEIIHEATSIANSKMESKNGRNT